MIMVLFAIQAAGADQGSARDGRGQATPLQNAQRGL